MPVLPNINAALRDVVIAATAFASTMAEADPYAPSAEDMEIITASLATQMLDPESTIVSGAIAIDEALDNSTMTWICGWVRGKNTFGGYAQPTEFIGSLLTNDDGKRVFLPIKIAGPGGRETAAILNLCAQKVAEERAK